LVPVVTVPPLSATAVVAVKAFPVHDPELPVTFPVTFPVNAPVKVVAVTVPAEEEEVPLLKLVAVVAVAAFPVHVPAVVAVAAFPVHEPELPEVSPVTFPVNGPMNAPPYTFPTIPAPPAIRNAPVIVLLAGVVSDVVIGVVKLDEVLPPVILPATFKFPPMYTDLTIPAPPAV